MTAVGVLLLIGGAFLVGMAASSSLKERILQRMLRRLSARVTELERELRQRDEEATETVVSAERWLRFRRDLKK